MWGRICLTISFLISCVIASRDFNRNGVNTVLALENGPVELQCQTDYPMPYCGFVHESGKRYSVSDPDLKNGRCTVQIPEATKNDSGQWICQMGSPTVGVEMRETINLRVGSKVSSIQKNMTAIHGKSATLECATVEGAIPIKYCRFEPPTGSPFSISSAITSENPILGKYYFPQNRSIDRGDCSVTISKVKYKDVGVWTCGVGLDDKEYTDTITLEVEGLYAMSTASATGITFGVIGAATFLFILGILVWKKRTFLGTGRQQEPEGIEIQEISARPSVQASPQLAHAAPTVTVQSPSESSLSASVLQ